MISNPFELYSYLGPDYFCDREDELRELLIAFENRRNVVLASPRRLGKTNLLQHFHHHVTKQKKGIAIYIDVMSTTSDIGFMNTFSSAVLTTLANKSSSLEKFLQAVRQVKPQVSVDPLTGMPSVTVNVEARQESKISFEAAMSLLLQRSENIQISIDEFQQIGSYREGTTIDATLRAYFPKAKNIHFVFSGSEEHMLTDLFTNPKKPLFASTQWMQLHKIGHSKYFNFIKEKFAEYDKVIDDGIIHQLLMWTEDYTFYTHYLCNQLFLTSKEVVTVEQYERSKRHCLKDFEATYLMLKRTLTANQWNLLAAIGREGGVSELYGSAFLSKYRLSSSNVKRGIQALLDRQLVRHISDLDHSLYVVYDVFLTRWLQSI